MPSSHPLYFAPERNAFLLTLVLALPVKAANACQWCWLPPWLGSKFETCSPWESDKPLPLSQSHFPLKWLRLLPDLCVSVWSAIAGRGTSSRAREWVLSNTWECPRRHMYWDFTGKGRPGGDQQGKGTQENWSATWLAVPDFMVMGLVSRLSLANNS